MMTFEEFEAKTHAAFDEIPPEFRERVEGPVVVRNVKRSGDIRGRVILGECVHAPDWTGQAELHSTVFLYYGSFAQIGDHDPAFDWDAEIVETVRHEVQHHVEDQIGHPRLRDLDWAAEQNAKRRAGRPFKAQFWRGGRKVDDPRFDLREIDGDAFLELALRGDEWHAAKREGLSVPVLGATYDIAPGAMQRDLEYFVFEGVVPATEESHAGHDGPHQHAHQAPTEREPGDLVIVVRRRKSLLDAFRRTPK